MSCDLSAFSGSSCIFTVTDMEQENTDEKVEDENDDKRKELFSQRMRAATRNIHSRSDALVNAKLGVTMSDDNVWAEGGSCQGSRKSGAYS